MTLGFYENFPLNIHLLESFNSAISSKQLQQKLIQALYEANRREFAFEEISNPTVPEGRVILEFGLAEDGGFNFIDDAELKKAQSFFAKEKVRPIDFFCVIRNYKGSGEKKKALKFDYYMLRTVFGKDKLEVQVYHERGPRYISPKDLMLFIVDRINLASNKKILRK